MRKAIIFSALGFVALAQQQVPPQVTVKIDTGKLAELAEDVQHFGQ